MRAEAGDAAISAEAPTLDDEREVIARLQAGDRAAVATLLDWYGDRLYRSAILPRLPITELAEDVLRDTFRTALEKIEQFKSGDTSIYWWMHRIAVNKAMDVHRRHKKDRDITERLAQSPSDSVMGQAPPAPDRGQHVLETKAQVDESLSLINERYATALRLRLLEDRDRSECAALLDVTVGTFDVLFHRACKAFAKVFPP